MPCDEFGPKTGKRGTIFTHDKIQRKNLQLDLGLSRPGRGLLIGVSKVTQPRALNRKAQGEVWVSEPPPYWC